MSKNIFNYLFAFLIFYSNLSFSDSVNSNLYSLDKNVFVGSIEFPNSVKNIPEVSIYKDGLKIKAETESYSKKIRFTISADKCVRTFYLLLAKEINPEIEKNTVKYLKIDVSENYKFYELTIFPSVQSSVNPLTKKEELRENLIWRIQEKKLNDNGVMPDDTLIIIFNPFYVEKLEGGNNLELPKIIIKKDVIQLAGSEKKLERESNELLLTSLDLNILHIDPAATIKHENGKKLTIAMSTPA